MVDASSLTAFILKEPGWRGLSRYLKLGISVDHVVKEVLNALWRAYALKGVIGVQEAIQLFRILESMIGVNILLEPEERYLNRAFKIALDSKITVYDALYIALAAEKRLPLLTLDEKQKDAARAVGIKIIDI